MPAMPMSARTAERLAEHAKLLFAGVAFLAVIALLVALAVAKYQKVFEPAVHVTLRADRAGLQLNEYGDVRMHGVLVGQVREIRQRGEGAVIELALEPDAAESVPADVRARILPTTLFGQKYVSLVEPETPTARGPASPAPEPAPEPIRDGDVIGEDRSAVATELNRVLDRLFPLLRSVKPAELAFTLNALATALEGRGESLGATLERMDAYLGEFNRHLPELRENIRLLSDFADTYHEAAPDLLRILRNAAVTARTVVENEDQLPAFYRDVAGVSRTAERVLDQNGERIIRLGEVTRPVLEVLATYAPEYPCLIRGLERFEKRLSETMRDGRFHLTVEIGPQKGGYTEEDAPVYGEAGHGPWCLGLPDDPPVPFPGLSIADGTDSDDGTGTLLPPPLSSLGRSLGAGTVSPTSGFAGTEAEQQVVNALLAPALGRPADRVPDVATLLYGPLLRGAVVNT